MKRYIALLRGINISGKNKVVMAELKNVTFKKRKVERSCRYVSMVKK